MDIRNGCISLALPQHNNRLWTHTSRLALALSDQQDTTSPPRPTLCTRQESHQGSVWTPPDYEALQAAIARMEAQKARCKHHKTCKRFTGQAESIAVICLLLSSACWFSEVCTWFFRPPFQLWLLVKFHSQLGSRQSLSGSLASCKA